MEEEKKSRGGRLALLDGLRGLTLVSMILYHFAWDLVYIAGLPWAWYRGPAAFAWQQSICCTFILLSGFCVPFSKNLAKRGLTVFLCGALVSLVTVSFLYEDRVIFGVLTLIGSCMLLAHFLRPVWEKVPAAAGLAVSAVLFYMFRSVNDGFLRLWPGRTVLVSGVLYRGYFLTYLGFPDRTFFSTDYFSLLPWVFLFFTGLFLHRLIGTEKLRSMPLLRVEIPFFSMLGRHSLLIYMLHQPVLYGLLMLFMRLH